jgi:hypothetical protein
MPTYVITHEVDDVDHWCNSPKRAEVLQTETAAEGIRHHGVHIDTLLVLEES